MYQEDELLPTIAEEVAEVRIPSKRIKKPKGKDITGRHVDRMCVICGCNRSWDILDGEVFAAGNVVATIRCSVCENVITYTASVEDAKVV